MTFTIIDALQFKKIGDCENIHSVNSLYLLVNHPSGYIEDKNWNKYLIFGNENDYEKDYMKIKFNSDNDLPLNKPLKFHAMTIIIRSIFEEGGKL